MAASNSATKRKRVVLSISDKLKIIKKIEDGGSTVGISSAYGIGVTTVKDLMKKKDSLKKFAMQFDTSLNDKTLSTRKTLKMSNVRTIDEAVYNWYSQQRSCGVAVRSVDIQAAAQRLSAHLNLEFNANNGWLHRFRKRHGIITATNQKSVIPDTTGDGFKKMFQKLISDAMLMPSQIYNADETVLFWRSLPEECTSFQQVLKTSEKDVSKEKFSTLICANADGTNKLKSVVVGKVREPWVVTNCIDLLPVHYYSARNSEFTEEIIKDWFFHHFEPEVRTFQLKKLKIAPEAIRAVLLLDNAPFHPQAAELSSVDGKIKCLMLPSTIPPIQPMGLGIVMTVKRLYKKKYVDQVMIRSSDGENVETFLNIKDYNIKSAIYNWNDAWNEVKTTTLTKAWKMLLQNVDPIFDLEGIEPLDYHKIFMEAGDKELTLEDVNRWLEQDNAKSGHEMLTEEEIAQNVSSVCEENEDSDEECKVEKPPELSEVRTSIDNIISYIDKSDDPVFASYYEELRRLRELVVCRQHQQTVPRKIHSFFKSPSRSTSDLAVSHFLTNQPGSSHSTSDSD